MKLAFSSLHYKITAIKKILLWLIYCNFFWLTTYSSAEEIDVQDVLSIYLQNHIQSALTTEGKVVTWERKYRNIEIDSSTPSKGHFADRIDYGEFAFDSQGRIMLSIKTTTADSVSKLLEHLILCYNGKRWELFSKNESQISITTEASAKFRIWVNRHALFGKLPPHLTVFDGILSPYQILSACVKPKDRTLTTAFLKKGGIKSGKMQAEIKIAKLNADNHRRFVVPLDDRKPGNFPAPLWLDLEISQDPALIQYALLGNISPGGNGNLIGKRTEFNYDSSNGYPTKVKISYDVWLVIKESSGEIAKDVNREETLEVVKFSSLPANFSFAIDPLIARTIYDEDTGISIEP